MRSCTFAQHNIQAVGSRIPAKLSLPLQCIRPVVGSSWGGGGWWWMWWWLWWWGWGCCWLLVGVVGVRSLGEGWLRVHLCRASEGPKRQEDVLCAHCHLVQNWPKERSWQVPLHDGVVGAPMVAACAKRGYCHDWLKRELPITCMLRLRATGPLCRSMRFL